MKYSKIEKKNVPLFMLPVATNPATLDDAKKLKMPIHTNMQLSTLDVFHGFGIRLHTYITRIPYTE